MDNYIEFMAKNILWCLKVLKKRLRRKLSEKLFVTTRQKDIRGVKNHLKSLSNLAQNTINPYESYNFLKYSWTLLLWWKNTIIDDMNVQF